MERDSNLLYRQISTRLGINSSQPLVSNLIKAKNYLKVLTALGSFVSEWLKDATKIAISLFSAIVIIKILYQQTLADLPAEQVFSLSPLRPQDLIAGMLTLDPDARLSASDALKHRYITSAHIWIFVLRVRVYLRCAYAPALCVRACACAIGCD